ncbi:hypothetical protein SESBI_31519 [Sesbania bispinosa]|nr:hypothetical protein SESBI_31519 [Sesbania bispinosa]
MIMSTTIYTKFEFQTLGKKGGAKRPKNKLYIQASKPLPQASTSNTLREGIGHNWKNPPLQVLKFNTDAAWSATRKTGAIAVVVRYHSGTLLSGLVKKILAPSPLAVEGIALRDAVLMPYNLNWNKACFTDSLPRTWVGSPPPWLLSIIQEDHNLSGTRHHSSSTSF